MSSKTISSIVLISLSLSVQGCAPALFMGAAGGVTAAASDERGFSGTMSDASIKAKIKMKYMNKSADLATETTVVVNEGKVLLTGVLDSHEMQIDAVRLAWEVEGVKEVVDDTRLGSNKTFGNYAKDAWITTQLKSKLLTDENIRSLNYSLHTVAGTVYLMGIAQDQEELQRVVDHARHTSGVSKVISHVKLRGQKASEDQTSSQAASSSFASSPASTQQVQRAQQSNIKTENLMQESQVPQPLEASGSAPAPSGFEGPNNASAFQ